MPKNDKKNKTFVLNDETKVNSYGFKVLNSGISLERFLANPLMLDYHMKGNNHVIGRWENIRIEGNLLLADAVFDEEDEEALKIKGKVDREFIKGCSMGLDIYNGKWEYQNEIPVLILCELTEASIASLPSNANSLKLYNASGELSDKDIKLSIGEFFNKTNPNLVSMKKLTLSVQTLLVLGLQNEQLEDNAVVSAAIEKMVSESEQTKVKLSAATTEINDLKGKLAAIDEAKAVSLVDNAVKLGKITADKKEYFLTLAKSDFATAEGILAGIPEKADLAGGVKNTNGSAGKFDNVKTMDDFEKLSATEKLAFKTEAPDQYKSIFNL